MPVSQNPCSDVFPATSVGGNAVTATEVTGFVFPLFIIAIPKVPLRVPASIDM